MKKILLIAVVAILSFNNSQAQMPDGSIAPDFTLTDMNGTSHNLYNLLDQGYTVFVDFSAIWCGPCWSYHESGALENLYIDHGPAGMPNVSANTTDDVMVFFIEGQEGTLAELNGGAGSQGDWVTGTPYPIIPTYPGTNSTQVTSDYQIGYWPTLYRICPDRITREGTSSNPYSLVSSCPAPASNDNDARTFDYAGETLTCEGDLTPEIMIQNYGLLNL
jgi:thiol-disulfide isomerase/thioredoxin